MRILVVTHAFGPESTAGTETIAAQTITSLQRSDIEVGLLAAFFTVPRTDELPVHLDPRSFFPIQKKRRAALWNDWDARARRHFRRTLKTFQPDVVYFHHTLFLSFDLPLIAARKGVRTVFMLHDFWLICPRSTLLATDGTISWTIDRAGRCAKCLALNRHPATRRLPLIRQLFSPRFARLLLKKRDHQTQQIFKEVDAFIAPSHTVANALLNRGLPPEKLSVIPLGIPSLGPSTKREGQPLQFGFIGTIVRHKGVASLIAAFSTVDRDQARLTIWGPNFKPHELDGVKDEPHITYAGAFAPTKTQEIYNQLDALIVPSLWFENQPLTILQAQAAGVPVITANMGGMAELVRHEQDGLLFAPHDTADLAATIKRFIDEPALRAKLRLGALKRHAPSPEEHLAQIRPILLVQ